MSHNFRKTGQNTPKVGIFAYATNAECSEILTGGRQGQMAQDSGVYLPSYFVVLYVFTRVDQHVHNDSTKNEHISRRGVQGATAGQKTPIPHGPPASSAVQRQSSFQYCTELRGDPR